MNKTCSQCSKTFSITQQDLSFYQKLSPTFLSFPLIQEREFKGEVDKENIKYIIPYPSICPDCWEQERLSFFNKRNLYKRKCDATWRPMISIYSPDKNITVYNKDYWWGSNWNLLDYWRDFNFTKPIFEQYHKIHKKVPKPNLSISNSVNCEYNDSIVSSKNCYMCFWCNDLEDTSYTDSSWNTKNSLDISWSLWIDNSYECLDSLNISKWKFCYDSDNSNNIMFCKWCSNCSDCFMCYWLQNKKYNILNKQYSKEEYQEMIKDLDLWSYENLNTCKRKFEHFILTQPHQNLNTYNAENCLWDYIYDCKDCFNCFNIAEVQNAKNLYEWARCENIYNSSIIYDSQNIIWSINVFWNSYNIYFSEYIYDNSYNIFYSSNLKWCKNCFLCIGLINKQYCILNKQYTKEEYEKLTQRIIKHMQKNWEWGKFFSPNISPFWYNETVAQEYYPLNKEKIEKNPPSPVGEGASRWGFNWSTYQPPLPDVEKIIPSEKLPDHIEEIPDDILNWAIECEDTQKPFKITKQELEFYRKNNLPIPRKHPDQRYKRRIKKRNSRKFRKEICNKCWINIETTYSWTEEKIIYCNSCYNKKFFS